MKKELILGVAVFLFGCIVVILAMIYSPFPY